MPNEESRQLIEMTREVCRKELAPQVDAFERQGGFPEQAFRTLGGLGLLSLPYPEEFGGGGQPYEVYLQVVEEIAQVWTSSGRKRTE
jgi:alkylation response protein AidB-like acyl-CoA dehydrogenase